MSNRQHLAGFGFSGFRSFGSKEVQRIAPLGDIHLVAGPNNAGKSNLITVLEQGIGALRTGARWDVGPADMPTRGYVPRTLSVGFDQARLDAAVDELDTKEPAAARAILDGLKLGDDELVWFDFEMDSTGEPNVVSKSQAELVATQDDGALTAFVGNQNLPATDIAHPATDIASQVLEHLVDKLKIRTDLPSVSVIPAERSLRDITKTVDDERVIPTDGSGLIGGLAKLQDPSYARWQDRDRFDGINRFVRELFNDPGAAIRIPYDRDTIVVFHDGNHLPLTSFGAGLQQVVIIATAATVLSDQIVCIEEPEVHLHPTLQRQLLRYLKNNTTNQYVIATHSAHLLDANLASITAVSKVDGQSVTQTAIEPAEISRLSSLLGARASDLVQSNAVIWVEGPSDRTYIAGWLRLVDPDLVEGAHYSVMFYGGATLSHLGALEPGERSDADSTANLLISLPRINRNLWVVIDSDRTSEPVNINATKQRVRDEFAQRGAGVWITDGYTIENYLPTELLSAAASSVHPTRSYTAPASKFDNPLAGVRFGDKDFSARNARIAVEVMANWGSRQLPSPLRTEVERIAKMIRKANDLLPMPNTQPHNVEVKDA